MGEALVGEVKYEKWCVLRLLWSDLDVYVNWLIGFEAGDISW